MKLTSTAFGDGGDIPAVHTQDGDDTSPPLTWSDAPPGTRTFALIVDDPDAPDPAAPKRTWVHWVLVDLPASCTRLPAGAAAPGTVGLNDWNHAQWQGPAPPIGRHRYQFKLYALDQPLGLARPTKADVERAMQGHVLAEARLVGMYQATPGR